jgi:PAS domain S-box-containing protein
VALPGSADTEDELARARAEIARLRAALAARDDDRLGHSAAFLEAIVENIPHMIFVKDAEELRFVRLNRAGEELLGYSSAELLGKNDFDFFPENEAQFFTDKDREVLAGEGLAVVTEEPIHTRHRGTRFLHTKKVPILDESGRARFLLGISEDVTDQKLAREETRAARLAAEEANRAKSEFLAFMSHEIRTPLNGLLGMARLLGGTHLDERQHEMVRTIVSSGERLLKIASDLLDLTRVEAGKLSIDRAPFDVAGAVRDVVAVFAERAARRAVALEVEVAPDVPAWVVGDIIRLQQVLTNLVGNAMRFTDHGRVTVKISSAERQRPGQIVLRFAVEDTGVGIAADHLPRLFDRFFEAGADTSARGGIGLGLLLSKRIVTQMGGTIWVASSPGQGSTFTFEVPFGVGQEDPAEPTDEVGELPPLRVLIVEDDAVGARVLQLVLERLGQEVELATDGKRAAELAAEGRFDAVLMDINLPGASGIEASRAIRERLGAAAPPIIAVTADAGTDQRERCLDAGMAAFLVKPVVADELHRELAHVARRRAAR